MKRTGSLVSLLGLASIVAVACGDDGASEAEGQSGAGGQPASVTSAGAGGEPEGGGCSSEGRGTLVVEVTGLPDELEASIEITGPDGELDPSDALDDVSAGSYLVSAARVFDEDPTVRTVYQATISAPSFCLGDGDSHTIEVEYAAIPSSNKLWMPTDTDVELAAFASAELAEGGQVDPSVDIDSPAGGSLAFDRDGNLWAFGPTLAEHHVERFPAAELGDSGAIEPDITFDLPDVKCIPAMLAMAFSPDGDLWLSTCGGEVHRIPAADLGTSGDKSADVVLSGLIDPDNELANNFGIAFDADGNLWVGGGGPLRRFDAARLDASSEEAADLELNVSGPLHASHIAFDKAGNLWGVDFGGGVVFAVPVSALEATGTQDVDPDVSVTLPVDVLLSQPAFDDGDGLWLGLSSGKLGRLSPSQLSVSTDAGDPTIPELILQTERIGAELPVALFPAPAGLPLYHSLPQP